MSAFALEDGVVYYTYSAFARGLDALWGMYQWLDRAPKGRNETAGMWWRRHDEYGSEAQHKVALLADGVLAGKGPACGRRLSSTSHISPCRD